MLFTKRGFIAATAAAFAWPAWAGSSRTWALGRGGAAADGADVVAYFALPVGAPAVKGKKKYSTTWDGAKWGFSSAANMEAFKANPSKYAPQFGGYSALGVAKGQTTPGKRDFWHIYQGKLYLNASKKARNRWVKNIDKHVRTAQANWPSVLNA